MRLCQRPPGPTRVHTDWVLACATEPGGLRAVTASADASLIRWDTVDGSPLRTLIGHEGSVRGCAIAQRRRGCSHPRPLIDRCASGTRRAGVRCSRSTGHRDWVNACAFDNSCGLVASVSNDRTLRLWDMRTRSRKIAVVAHEHWVNACAFSPDGRFVVTAAADGLIRRWSLDFDESVWELWISGAKHLPADIADRALQPFDLDGHEHSANQCVFAADGSFMVSASSDGSLRLWDVARGQQLGALVGHDAEVGGCDVSPDGSLVASVSSDGAVKLWDRRNAACLTTLHVDGALSSCTFTQEGSALVAVGDKGVYFLGLVGVSGDAAKARTPG